jgi:hypothetical protein
MQQGSPLRSSFPRDFDSSLLASVSCILRPYCGRCYQRLYISSTETTIGPTSEAYINPTAALALEYPAFFRTPSAPFRETRCRYRSLPRLITLADVCDETAVPGILSKDRRQCTARGLA